MRSQGVSREISWLRSQVPGKFPELPGKRLPKPKKLAPCGGVGGVRWSFSAILIYEDDRRGVLEMEDGLRTINIASANPNSTKEEQAQREVPKNLTRRKTHIDAIQAKHITQDRECAMGKLQDSNDIFRKI